jgi:hypothetical protein
MKRMKKARGFLPKKFYGIRMKKIPLLIQLLSSGMMEKIIPY